VSNSLHSREDEDPLAFQSEMYILAPGEYIDWSPLTGIVISGIEFVVMDDQSSMFT
jgi:hypothetical protein